MAEEHARDSVDRKDALGQRRDARLVGAAEIACAFRQDRLAGNEFQVAGLGVSSVWMNIAALSTGSARLERF
jgi:hypothetical protein